MDYQKLVEKLEALKEFKEYKKNSPAFYLVHIFSMEDASNKGLYQLGYLNPKNDRITSFTVGQGKVEINPESEVLKEPEATIFPLDMQKVKLTEEEMLKIVTEFKNKEYASIHGLKKFYILQHLDIGQLFNFTLLTLDFKTLNIKVDAATGEILRHSMQALMDFDKPGNP